MAGGLNKLSAVAVQKAKEPGYYGDGGGLWLQISKLGGKSLGISLHPARQSPRNGIRAATHDFTCRSSGEGVALSQGCSGWT